MWGLITLANPSLLPMATAMVVVMETAQNQQQLRIMTTELPTRPLVTSDLGVISDVAHKHARCGIIRGRVVSGSIPSLVPSSRLGRGACGSLPTVEPSPCSRDCYGGGASPPRRRQAQCIRRFPDR